MHDLYRNRNRKLQTSKAPLKSQAQGTSLFTSAASNQRVFPIVRGRLRSGCQRVRECVKSEGFAPLRPPPQILGRGVVGGRRGGHGDTITSYYVQEVCS